jgi:hydroxyethylthiazole kinase-like sugar kinase family protein
MGFFFYTNQAERDLLSTLMASDIRSRLDEVEWLILEEGKRRGISCEPRTYDVRAHKAYLNLRLPVLEVLSGMAYADLRGNDDEIRWLLRAEGQRRNLDVQKGANVRESNSMEESCG